MKPLNRFRCQEKRVTSTLVIFALFGLLFSACDQPTGIHEPPVSISMSESSTPKLQGWAGHTPSVALGEYVVVLGDPGTCELAISDVDALEEVENLLAEVDALEASGSLNSGQARALRNHLNNAARQIQEGRYCPALAQLRAFHEQVLNFVDDGILSEEEAQPLIDGIVVILGGSIFVTITHSLSQTVVAGNSVACSPDGGLTTFENGYLRIFDLEDFGISNALNITEVTFGIESLSGVAQQITVNLFTLDDAAFTYANLTNIGTTAVTMEPPQTLTLVTVPVTGTAPAGSTLVVEIDAPSVAGTGGFFIGSNAGGQTGPSYLRSASCGLPEPTDVASVGFPNMHIVINVAGTTLAN